MPREHRKNIEEAAERGFKNHVMSVKGTAGPELRPYVWRCENPESWPYWFYVAELPGAIVQYGDIGGMIIEQGAAYDLAWLNGAIESMDYVLSKSKFQRTYFVEEQFKTYVTEHGKNPDDYEGYADYALDTGDSDAYESCHDWPIDALWGYWALRRFVELRRAG